MYYLLIIKLFFYSLIQWIKLDNKQTIGQFLNPTPTAI